MNNLDSNIFGNKNLKDLFQEIYNNQKKKSKQILTLIGELKPMVKDIGDATLLVPLIKEYLEIDVKNDEHLIKMAGIIQRCLVSTGPNGQPGELLTPEERKQLMDDINKIDKDQDSKSEQ